MIGLWMRGLLVRRPGQFFAVAGGIALAVSLLASLGSFLAAANGSMTARAASTVAVDWQVQAAAGTDTQALSDTVRHAPGVRTAIPIRFARATGLSATTGGTTQTTGTAVAVELPAGYLRAFPGQVRFLTGRHDGVLIAQQTASNLHAAPGDRILIQLADAPPAEVTVAGVIDLPQANSLFQKVGAPPQSQPIAPPDNVILLPTSSFAAIQSRLAGTHSDQISTQIHVARSHALPPDPATAFTTVTEAANNLDAKLAGTGQVGDNLGAALGAARSDAAYATILFLFLGLPGAVLSGILTFAIASAAGPRRRADQALLRARGSSARTVTTLVAVEAAAAGVVGGLIGLGAAALIGWLMFGSPAFGSTDAGALVWPIVAFVAGLVIALLAVLVPALRDFRTVVVSAARVTARAPRRPWWMRAYIDGLLIAVALAIIAITTQAGYTLVLAPEGVPSIQINYWAFFGPGLLWIGVGLLVVRLVHLALRRGHAALTVLARPIAGNLASTAASTMARQRSLFATSIVMLTLALAFAASTAVFNATYQHQAEVDARLTNGADVTVTFAPGAAAKPSDAETYRKRTGVASVEPLEHRFAYVGSDLQDLFGVRPASIASTTSLQDAYFQGGTAAELMKRLASTPDAILVSAETVKDYQLHTGDTIRLRLQDARTATLTTVPFRYVGVAKEFPTAPKDSFFIANADYIAKQTGNPSISSLLISTGSANPADVARTLQTVAGRSATVVPIGAARSAVGSSLTSVDLGGLTRIELLFAFLLAATAGGVVFAIGLAERRRSFAIASVLGAKRSQLRSLVLVEALTIIVGGLIGGSLLGWGLSEALVAVLTGVFDPPPDTLTVPWWNLSVVVGIAIAAILTSALIAARRSANPAVETLRSP